MDRAIQAHTTSVRSDAAVALDPDSVPVLQLVEFLPDRQFQQ